MGLAWNMPIVASHVSSTIFGMFKVEQPSGNGGYSTLKDNSFIIYKELYSKLKLGSVWTLLV